MRIRAIGWSKVAVVWLCVLALAGSGWMLGCGDDKADNGNGNGGDAAKPDPEPAPPAGPPATQPAKVGTKKGPAAPLKFLKKLTDGK